MAFGAWHVLPAIDRLQHNPGVEEFRRHRPLSKAGVVAAAVGATTLAGLGLSLVRARTKSILPPMLLHASVNAGAYGAGWLAARREGRIGEAISADDAS
jgi:membrane protease YdiL (CAAX protease family)